MRIDEHGRPLTGRAADRLGVRIEARPPRGRIDLVVGADGTIRLGPRPQGMSVQIDDPRGAQPHRLPEACGGTSQDTLFELDEADLPELLAVCPDHDRHAVIGPRRDCSLVDYEAALNGTQTLWRKTDVGQFPPLSRKAR